MVKSNAILTGELGNYFLTINRVNFQLNLIFTQHRMHFVTRFALLMLLVIPAKTYANDIISNPPISGHAIALETISPADVLSRVNLAAEQLEQIRVQLNLPLANQLDIQISEAQPREVYFQALAFYGRVNRLTFERLRVLKEYPSIALATNKALKPYHVWQITDKASVQLLTISKNLQLDEVIVEKEAAQSTTPSDVFMALLKVNRQLDIMLEQPFSPNDVYQQVTLGVHYMAKILASYSIINRIPEPPKYIGNKKPVDVWLLLAECFDLLRDIAKNYGEKTLFITTDSNIFDTIRPGDVYQYAALLVSELAYLHSLLDNVENVVPTIAVNDKMPTDVYQRVGLLRKQLEMLKSLSIVQQDHGGPIDEK